MAEPIRVKLILQLHALGISQNSICDSYHMGKHSVSDVINIAKVQGLTYDKVKDLPEEEVYSLIFPDKNSPGDLYELPDYEYVHKELFKTGVTKKLLHQEYVSECIRKNTLYIGYTKFCNDLKAYRQKNNLTAVLEHLPGDRVEVDWAGPTMHYIDKETGKKVPVYLFVADLPCSRLGYVEPVLEMDEMNWLLCNIHMFEYFGGVPRLVVCDNLRTGVITHKKGHVVTLNKEYETFAEYYHTAILPCAVRAPRQKNCTEGTVGDIETDIMARLRNTTFYSLEALKKAVAEKLEEHNNAPFEKREDSRRISFEDQEREALKPLPSVPYEVGEWVYDRVLQNNCHVSFQKNFYSYPWKYYNPKEKTTCDIRYTPSTVSIYVKGERVKTHYRYPKGYAYQYRTDKNDLPKSSEFREWTQERLMSWASSIGHSTAIVCQRIFEAKDVPEQAFNSVLSVLNLGQTYTHARLETACEMSLKKMYKPMYHQLNAILSSQQDRGYVTKKQEEALAVKGCLRGADYYRKLAERKEEDNDGIIK